MSIWFLRSWHTSFHSRFIQILELLCSSSQKSLKGSTRDRGYLLLHLWHRPLKMSLNFLPNFQEWQGKVALEQNQAKTISPTMHFSPIQSWQSLSFALSDGNITNRQNRWMYPGITDFNAIQHDKDKDWGQ